MIEHGYPRLQPDSYDYLNPAGYAAQLIRKSSQRMDVEHQLQDLKSLPGQWLKEGYASLTCEIRAPHMLYCLRHDHDPTEQEWSEAGNRLTVTQQFDIPHSQDQRIYFIPSIVLNETRVIKLSSEKHGVSDIWNEKTVCFPKGAVLAGGKVFEDIENVVHLLTFRLDPELEEGVIRGHTEEDDDAWRYVVHVHQKTLSALHSEQNSEWFNALYIGCLAQMLAAIQRDFKEEPQYEALKVLAEMVRTETGLAPPWETDGLEWDDALKIATHLHSLITPQQE